LIKLFLNSCMPRIWTIMVQWAHLGLWWQGEGCRQPSMGSWWARRLWWGGR
jgi:hypothetical protein